MCQHIFKEDETSQQSAEKTNQYDVMENTRFRWSILARM
jgi:hypothetical protein